MEFFSLDFVAIVKQESLLQARNTADRFWIRFWGHLRYGLGMNTISQALNISLSTIQSKKLKWHATKRPMLTLEQQTSTVQVEKITAIVKYSSALIMW